MIGTAVLMYDPPCEDCLGVVGDCGCGTTEDGVVGCVESASDGASEVIGVSCSEVVVKADIVW